MKIRERNQDGSLGAFVPSPKEIERENSKSEIQILKEKLDEQTQINAQMSADQTALIELLILKEVI